MPKIQRRIPTRGEVKTIEDSNGSRMPVTEFQVTDKALGLAAGNTYAIKPKPHPITRWGDYVAPLRGEPDIDQNPYNFVPLGTAGPWEEPTPHPDHEGQRGAEITGWLDYEIELKTPLFVPEGFPAPRQLSSQEQDDLKEVPRHFSRMRDETGTVRYVVPGSSLKGLIRGEVEALTNSLFGASDRKAHERRHLYRRRALNSAGVIDTSTEPWQVREVNLAYVDNTDWPGGFASGAPRLVVAFHNRDGERTSKMRAVPPNYIPGTSRGEREIEEELGRELGCPKYRGGLFAARIDKPYSHLLLFDAGQVFDLPKCVRDTYHNVVLKHPHFKEHAARNGRDKKTRRDKYPDLMT